MKERIAIIEGVRTPFCKAPGALRDLQADDLGAFSVQELLARTGIPPKEVDELVFGNVLQPPHATNIARVLAIKGGLPISTPAFTVNRNCSSGMEAVVTAANKILLDQADIMIAGGTESMSHFPILFSNAMRKFLTRLNKAKTWQEKIAALTYFRPSLLKPEIPEIADPLCGLSMGQTAEVLAREFHITREEQDRFALASHERASKATQEGILAQEIVPVAAPPKFNVQIQDEGPRNNATLEALAKLKPVFDPIGSVTAGNSSQITDGACALLLMRESKAKSLGLKPLGYLTAYSYAALDPRKMGLGPAYAIAKLLKQTNRKLAYIQLIEINEAFAAQVLAVLKALGSKEFCKDQLDWSSPVGEIDRDILNVNGGAIALGHPLGASGARLILTLLKELNRRKLNIGLASLCIGGGQGEAVIVETAS